LDTPAFILFFHVWYFTSRRLGNQQRQLGWWYLWCWSYCIANSFNRTFEPK